VTKPLGNGLEVVRRRVGEARACVSKPLWANTLHAGLRRDLLLYLAATSEERARLIGELTSRNPGIADLLIDLETDDDLRARFEIELLRANH